MRKKSKIESATSMKNGIRFYSLKEQGHLAIATVDKDGNITTSWMTKEEYKNSSLLSKFENIIVFATILLIILLAEKLELLDFFKDLSNLRYILLVPVIILVLFFIPMLLSRKNTEMFKFHAAEHMILNAFRELDRLPTAEEVRKSSRFSNTCGSTESALLINTFPIYFVLTYIPNIFFKLFKTYFFKLSHNTPL